MNEDDNIRYHIEDHYLVVYGESFNTEYEAQQECDYLNDRCGEQKYFAMPH